MRHDGAFKARVVPSLLSRQTMRVQLPPSLARTDTSCGTSSLRLPQVPLVPSVAPPLQPPHAEAVERYIIALLERPRNFALVAADFMRLRVQLPSAAPPKSGGAVGALGRSPSVRRAAMAAACKLARDDRRAARRFAMALDALDDRGGGGVLLLPRAAVAQGQRTHGHTGRWQLVVRHAHKAGPHRRRR